MMKKYNEGFYFLPLGGTGEFGSSLNLYGCDGDWIIVDMGVSFGSLPIQEVIIPDPTILEKLKNKIKCILLTHAHEDHYGALPYIWSKVGCPIYGSKFSIEMAKEKMHSHSLHCNDFHITNGEEMHFGNFMIKFVHMNHSIPESCAIIIKTSYGTIVHSGDWKMGFSKLAGGSTDTALFKKYGDEGVLAFVSDSTNVMDESNVITEEEVRENIIELVKKFKGKCICISCFSSNVARMETFAIAAKETNRKVLLSGRSLKKVEKVGRKCGYLKEFPNFGSEEDFKSLERENILLVCTGSQGERNSALSKIANGNNKNIQLKEGDIVIFSSKEIPGNEKNITGLQNLLSKNKIKVVKNSDHIKIHSSGHASRSDLMEMHKLLRPKFLIPVHGDALHLEEHALLGQENGIKSIVINDGDIVDLNAGKIVEKFKVEKLSVDGNRLIHTDGRIYAEKLDLLEFGVVFATISNTKRGPVISNISYYGLFENGDMHRDIVSSKIKEEFQSGLKHLDSRVNNSLESLARTSIKKKFFEICLKKPIVIVHFVQ